MKAAYGRQEIPVKIAKVNRNLHPEAVNKTQEIESVSGVAFVWKHISMDTLARICETLDRGIMDVIELSSDEPSVTRGNDRTK